MPACRCSGLFKKQPGAMAYAFPLETAVFNKGSLCSVDWGLSSEAGDMLITPGQSSRPIVQLCPPPAIQLHSVSSLGLGGPSLLQWGSVA